MSNDGGATPIEAILKVASGEVTPRRSKGALGAWWAVMRARGEGHRAHKPVAHRDAESWIKPVKPGVHAGQRLSLGRTGKGPRGPVTKVANRTREIRPSGMKTGASGNVTMGVGLRAAAKAGELPPNPTVRASEIYPDISKSGSGEGRG